MQYPKLTHVSATEDNAAATVTITGSDDYAIYIANISVYFDGTVSNLAVILDDDETEVWRGVTSDENGKEWDFSIPLKITAGNDAVIELAASGTGGTSGTVHVWYFIGE